MSSRPTKVQSLLKRTYLGKLTSQCQKILAFETAVMGCLPEPLAQHCHLSNISNTALVLESSSPVWTAKLRFQTSHILKKIKQVPELQHIQAIRIRTVPSNSATKQFRQKPTKPCISESSAKFLQDIAESTPDPTLKACYLRLSKHTRK